MNDPYGDRNYYNQQQQQNTQYPQYTQQYPQKTRPQQPYYPQQYPQYPSNQPQSMQPNQPMQFQEIPQYIGQPTGPPAYIAPPEDRKSERLKMLAIIVIILVIVSVVSIAAISLLSSDTDGNGEEIPSVRVNASNPKKTDYGWEILISLVSGDKVKLDDIRFELEDSDSNNIYGVYITDADPSKVKTSNGDIYAIPSDSGPVIDAFQGKIPIVGNSSIYNYENCYLAFLDNDRNYKLSSGDKVHIFKDFNSDGKLDVIDGDSLSLFLGKDVILKKSI